jgi:hypothetical protein
MGSGRVVAVGDLNASWAAWQAITRGLGLQNERGRWTGGETHLIQIGDVFNRGPGARHYFKCLVELQRQAADAGGQVTQLLGNHEVLTVLGVEAWCTTEEYMAWATDEELDRWPRRVAEYQSFLLAVPAPGLVLPLGPQLEVWKALKAPGREAMRADLARDGSLGKLLRSLPLAVEAGGCVFVHAPLTPRWARLGIEKLNKQVQKEWRDAPAFYRSMPRTSLFRSSQGPLWNRRLATKKNLYERRQLERSLALLGVPRMVTGHTMTETLPGGAPGQILGRHDGKLWCIDVGLGSAPVAALVIDSRGGWQWSTQGYRPLWRRT